MNPAATLTPFQEQLILSACPRGSRITQARYFRREYLPCPVHVEVQVPEGPARSLVLRIARHGGVGQEARLLALLAEAGLPVPEVLAGPAADTNDPNSSCTAVYSLLPGLNLQEFSERSAEDCRLAAGLVLDAAHQQASLTPKLRSNPRADFVPTITMRDRLQAVLERDDRWLDEHVFRAAARTLNRILLNLPEQTVFANGDYQPGNFLTDGSRVTGFVDFELACYQDFLFGFAKYPVYDLHPLNKAGFISLLLERERVDLRDFGIRLALGCLITLQREIPIRGGDTGYRDHVLGLLDRACRSL